MFPSKISRDPILSKQLLSIPLWDHNYVKQQIRDCQSDKNKDDSRTSMSGTTTLIYSTFYTAFEKRREKRMRSIWSERKKPKLDFHRTKTNRNIDYLLLAQIKTNSFILFRLFVRTFCVLRVNNDSEFISKRRELRRLGNNLMFRVLEKNVRLQ